MVERELWYKVHNMFRERKCKGEWDKHRINNGERVLSESGGEQLWPVLSSLALLRVCNQQNDKPLILVK